MPAQLVFYYFKMPPLKPELSDISKWVPCKKIQKINKKNTKKQSLAFEENQIIPHRVLIPCDFDTLSKALPQFLSHHQYLSRSLAAPC